MTESALCSVKFLASIVQINGDFTEQNLWSNIFTLRDPYEYVTGQTDAYRLNGININARLSFDDFRAVLDGTKPTA